MKHIKQCLALLLALALLAGCAAAEEELSDDSEARAAHSVLKETPVEGNICDNPALYEGRDPYSVINMYLTVSSGNEADSSNHTWTEVNSYSAYYYEDLGIDRYKVEGILQIDDGNGLGEGSYGYGEVVPNVTVQVRGQTSSESALKNYKIRIKAGKGEYNGQRTLALNKHAYEPFRFLNKMCYDLLADIPQLMSARTQFVRLYVKDTTEGGSGEYEDYGLYTMVEQINKTYLKNHGLDERGKLYKVNMFEWQTYDEIMAVGNDYDEDAFEYYLEIKGSDDHSDLREVLAKLENYSIPITEIIEEHFDAENLCYWTAFQILVGNYDSGPRNLYIYSPLNSKKWYFISWDMDAAFRRNYNIYRNHVEGQSWERGLTQYVSLILYNRMMKVEKYRQQLDGAIHDLLENVITSEVIAERTAMYSSVVKADIFENSHSRGSSEITPEVYDRLVGSLSSEIEMNYEYYLESLKKPWPFYVGLPVDNGEGFFYSWEISYDIHGESVTYSYQIATDYQFQNVLYEDSSLSIPYAETQRLEPGTYYLRVQATNESGYTTDCYDYFKVSGIGKIYGCYCFVVEEDGTIKYGVEEEK